MRLAIIRRRYNPFGGAERFIAQLSNTLATRDVSVTILSGEWAPSGSSVSTSVSSSVSASPGSPTVLSIPSARGSRTKRAQAFEKGVHDALRQTHFTLVQSHERLLGADIYRLGDGVHAAWVDRMEAEFRRHHPLLSALGLASVRFRWDPYHRMVLGLEAKMAADPTLHFVANSQLVKDELVRYYKVDTQRITLIPNGVDTQKFAPAESGVRKALRVQMGVQGNQPVALFVGSGFRRKGAFELVRAAAAIPTLSVWIVGKDKESQALGQLIQTLGLSARVHLLGPRQDVAALMQAADIFCLPSLYDPSPNAVLEALACGLPVLATKDIGTIDEIVGARAGALIDRDPDQIASALACLIDPDRRAPLAHAARQLALRFDQSEVVGRWLRFYEAQIKRKQSGPS
jgi:UDP-glucose:(heptosyl)LPS alpha-1,3-glucosyltransferase